MRQARSGFFLSAIFLLCLCVSAADYKLKDGRIITSTELLSAQTNGINFLTNGLVSHRIAWAEFTSETLKRLYEEIPQDRTFKRAVNHDLVMDSIKALIEVKPPVKTGPGTPVVTPTPTPDPEPEIKIVAPKRAKPPRLELLKPDGLPPNFARPMASPSIISAIFNPMGGFLLICVILANLYAAAEIASYRKRPPKPILLLSGFFPFVAPLVFLCLPTRELLGAARTSTSKKEKTEKNSTSDPAEMREQEALAKQAAESAQAADDTVLHYFHKDQTKFNRRFFETRMMTFMKLNPSHNQELILRTPREDLYGHRITKTTDETITLTVAVNTVWEEREVNYFEIVEVYVRRLPA